MFWYLHCTALLMLIGMKTGERQYVKIHGYYELFPLHFYISLCKRFAILL